MLNDRKLEQMMTRCDFDSADKALDAIHEWILKYKATELICGLDLDFNRCGWDACNQEIWLWEITVTWHGPLESSAMPVLTGWLKRLMSMDDNTSLWITGGGTRLWNFQVPFDGVPRTVHYRNPTSHNYDVDVFSKWELRFVYRVMKFLMLLQRGDLPCPTINTAVSSTPNLAFNFLNVPPPK